MAPWRRRRWRARARRRRRASIRRRRPDPSRGRSEQGSADSNRVLDARGARQEQDGDFCRQCSGGSGRHHDPLPHPGGVLRAGGRRRGGQGSRAPANVPANANTGLPQDAHDIRRIEARGDVTVITKDQNASGDLGVYDLKIEDDHADRQRRRQPGQERRARRPGGGRYRNRLFAGRVGPTSTATTPSRVRALILPGKGGNGSPSNVMTLGSGHN